MQTTESRKLLGIKNAKFLDQEELIIFVSGHKINRYVIRFPLIFK